MNINSTDSLIDLMPSPTLQNLLRNKTAQKFTADNAFENIAVDTSIISRAALVAGSGQTSLMAGNFVDDNATQSKYIMARKESFQTEKSFTNKRAGLVSTLAAQLDLAAEKDEDFYVKAIKIGLRVNKMVKRIEYEETTKASERNLKESKEHIEKTAEKAMAPRGAEGSPVPAGTVDDPQPVAAPEAGVDPATVVSAAGSALVGVASSYGGAGAVPAVASPALDAASLDITV